MDALANFECSRNSDYEVLPAIESTLDISKAIAHAVAIQAMEEGVTNEQDLCLETLSLRIEQAFWNPNLETFHA
ncbi:hypothetical protein ACFSJQ_19250 [Vibrio olivae]